MKYQDTTELKNLNVEIRNKAIELAMEKKVKLYGVSTRFEAQLISLYTGQIQHIRSNYPKRVVVKIVDRNTTDNFYPMSPYDEAMVSNGTAIKVCIDDLRICKSDLDNPELKSQFKKPGLPSERAETTYLNIIGGLVELILRKPPLTPGNKKPHPVFKTQNEIVESLVTHHQSKPGISERTLQEKFAAAKRSLLSSE